MNQPRKLGLGDPNAPKFDPTVLTEEGSSFRQVQEDGTAAIRQPSTNPATFATPPPATPTGVTGQMPIPTGVAVTPANLTPMERATLEGLGWKEGQAIPGDLPSMLSEAKNQNLQQATNLDQLPPPGDPAAVPPLAMPPLQNLDELPAAKQAGLMDDLPQATREHIKAALAQAQIDAAKAPDTFQAAGPGLADAAAGVVHRVVNLPDTPVVDDREAVAYASGEPRHEQPQQQTAATASPLLQTCPHCQWDLSQPTEDIAVTEDDKQTFLQATIGGRQWQKQYTLLNGQLAITFRQLSPGEVDACYQQVQADQRQGRVTNRVDFWEQINRYRMVLQLVDFRSQGNLTPFPESLEVWGGQPTPGNPTSLPQVVEQVNELVITSETLHRIIRSTAATFNRLATKMEVMVDRPDFWEPAGTRT